MTFKKKKHRQVSDKIKTSEPTQKVIRDVEIPLHLIHDISCQHRPKCSMKQVTDAQWIFVY